MFAPSPPLQVATRMHLGEALAFAYVMGLYLLYTPCIPRHRRDCCLQGPSTPSTPWRQPPPSPPSTPTTAVATLITTTGKLHIFL